MSTLRLAIAAVVLFAAAFFGISWASKGFPVMAMRAAPPMRPAAQVATAEPSVKQAVRKDQTDASTARGDGDPKREALRRAALQAANAFALSPCEPAMKKKLVEALSAYAKAWSEIAGCTSGACGDRKLDTAAAAFSTPADMRVRAALRAAFGKGGVSRQDFPDAIRLGVTMLAGDPGDPVSACASGRRADADR